MLNRMIPPEEPVNFSGAGINLKVGGGGTHPPRSAGSAVKKFVVPRHFFGSTSTISHFGEHYRDGQYSLVSFLFAVLVLTMSFMSSRL